MNRVILGRRYSLQKYLAVFAITAGIIVCTLATAKVEKVGSWMHNTVKLNIFPRLTTLNWRTLPSISTSYCSASEC